MAINSFDRPAEYTAMNTYTPIPFQELMAAGLQREKQYAAGEADTEELDNNLSSQYGLSQVQAPGTGEVFDVGDAARVEARKEYYHNNIASLVNDMPDKGSPLYRQKVAGLVKQMRKDLSPAGVFGSAAANRQTYSEMLKEAKTAEDAGNQPWLFYDKHKSIKDFAKASNEGVALLNNMGSIGKDPQVNKQLTDVLGNMKASLSTKLNADLANGIISKDAYEEIAWNTAYENAYNTIIGTASIREPLKKEAAWRKEVNGEEVSVEQVAENLAKNMANVFAYSKSTKDLDLNAAWAARQDEQKTPSLYDLPFNYNVKGTGYKSTADIQRAIGETTSQIQTIQQQLADANASTLDVITDVQTQRPTSKADLITKLQGQLAELENKAGEAKGLEDQANRAVGLSEDDYSQTDIDAAKAKTAKGYNTQESRQDLKIMLQRYQKQGKHPEIKTVEDMKNYLVETNWKQNLPDYSDKHKKKEEFIESQSEVRTINQNLIYDKGDKPVYSDPAFKSTLLSGGSLKWAETEGGKFGEVPVKDLKNASAENSVILGHTVMPNNEYVYIVDVYDNADTPTKIGRVMTKGSSLDQRFKVASGKLEDPTTGLREVSAQANMATDNTEGHGDVYFNTGRKDIKGTPQQLRIKVANKFNEQQPYRLLIPNESGPDTVKSFDTLQERDAELYKMKVSASMIK